MSLEIRAPYVEEADRVVTPKALAFLELLAKHFEPHRKALLRRRLDVQRSIGGGKLPDFLDETKDIRERSWTVAPAPADLNDRRVEITGPVERKMMINALNSGAKVFMADFEDALSPPWTNVIGGQVNCIHAVRRTLEYTSPEGKGYRLGDHVLGGTPPLLASAGACGAVLREFAGEHEQQHPTVAGELDRPRGGASPCDRQARKGRRTGGPATARP